MHLKFYFYSDRQLEIDKSIAQYTKDTIAREVISVHVCAERPLATLAKRLLTPFAFLLFLPLN